MDSIRRFGLRLNTRYLIFGLVIWWLAMIIGYSIITFRTDHYRNQLSKSGIEIAHEFSDLISLPLLEKKDQAIRTLLADAAKRTDVIYASVVDHQDKVVAFTGTGHLMPDKTETVRSVEKVSIWQGGFASQAKILNFSSDVTYGGTKIGEIFIGLSTTKTLNTRNQYLFIAVSSCLVLLYLLIVFRYETIRTFLVKYINDKRSKPVMDSISKGSPVHCPLCGTQKPFSDKLFNRSNPDRFFTIRATKHGPNAGDVADSKRIDLLELAKKEDLSWIRRRIILRCTEIINKLVA